MLRDRFKWLRFGVIANLVLLALQFEIGMAVNLSALPALPTVGFSYQNIINALDQAGNTAMIHAILGTFLTVVALIGLIMTAKSGIRSVIVFGCLGFVSIALAEINGVLFTLSGFRNDNYSHGMATGFILTFGFYFLELYFLKPKQPSKK